MKLLSLPHYNNTVRRALSMRVRYGFGAKFSDFTDRSPWEIVVDCSGFMRWFIYHASDAAITLPDGSYGQRDWCIKEGLESWEYERVLRHVGSGAWIAFITPTSDHAGHVWCVRYGLTMESYGGHGIGQRSAFNATLKREVDYCFRIL